MPRKSKKPVRKQTQSPTGEVVGQVGQILLPMIAGIAATKADLTEWVYEQGLTALHLLLKEDAEERRGDRRRASQVLIFLSNLRMVPRARLSCWFLRRAFGEELVSKFLDSPDCENIHPYAAPFTRCGQQDCEREFYRGLLGKEVRNDFRPTFEFSEGALE